MKTVEYTNKELLEAYKVSQGRLYIVKRSVARKRRVALRRLHLYRNKFEQTGQVTWHGIISGVMPDPGDLLLEYDDCITRIVRK